MFTFKFKVRSEGESFNFAEILALDFWLGQ